MSEQRYTSRVTQTKISEAPPTVSMPVKVVQESALDINAKGSWWARAFGFVALCVVFFVIADTSVGLVEQFAHYPILTSIKGTLLAAAVGCVAALCWTELRGYRQARQLISQPLSLRALESEVQIAAVDQSIRAHASQFASSSYAGRCYQTYLSVCEQGQTAQERIRLYREYVQQPVWKKANEVIKRQSMTAGSLAFISPNALIQTLSIVWTSLRTIRQIIDLYGIRPGVGGSWSLMSIIAQNIAAQSVFDMATDEVVNQLSGSLSAKFMENSAEAVAAGALNVRLGKALLKMIDPV